MREPRLWFDSPEGVKQMSDDLAYLSLAEVAGLIERGEVSPVEVTQTALDRTERLNSQLNAFITVLPERALDAARQAEAEITQGNYRGPLHGVPYSLKDLVETSGVRTTAGSPILKDSVPAHDATIYTHLQSAGGILLGKNSMLEFAYGSPHPDFGLTANPWNLNHSTSGSSSGSGAAVAAGLGYASIGSDTGGSIRHPSAYCGLIGLKPTHGRVSLNGIIPLAATLDVVGPMTRTARDAAIVLNAVAGYDPADPFSVDAPVADYLTALDNPLPQLRVGVDFGPLEERADPEIVNAVRQAIEVLQAMGMTITPVTMPDQAIANYAAAVSMSTEAAAVHRAWYGEHPELYSDAVRSRLRQGMGLLGVDYAAAQLERARLSREYHNLFNDIDVLVTSVSTANPTTLDQQREEMAHPNEDWLTSYFSFTRPISLIGYPALSMPGGMSENGLPIGIHLVGRPFEEATILAVADRFERETGWTSRHPDL